MTLKQSLVVNFNIPNLQMRTKALAQDHTVRRQMLRVWIQTSLVWLCRFPAHSWAAAQSQRAEQRVPGWLCAERIKQWSSLQLCAGKWQLASSLFGLISLETSMKYYLLIRNVQDSPIGVGSSTLSVLGGASIRHEPLSWSQMCCYLVGEIIV